MRVATYTRISTDEVNQPYSLGAQSERLASYVKSQEDWELVATFTDQISGAKLERPGLGKALAAASAGRFDLLLVYRVDRLSRSVRGLAQVLEDLDTAGVAFRSATEPFDTASPAGRMMVQMLGVFAEFERATIIDRVIAGMERKAAQGNWCGGHEPFGYRVVKGEGRLSVDEDEALLVELVFDLYVHKRLGSHAIANRLNASGLRTRAGKPWSYKAILTMLRNRTYLGFVHFRDVWTKGEHRPLVPEALFDAAQALLIERGEDVAKRAANGSPASSSAATAGGTSPARPPVDAMPPTATTPVPDASATALTPAGPTGCRPVLWTTPSSTRWSPRSKTPTCSPGPPPRQEDARVPTVSAATPSWRPSTSSCTRPKPALTATSAPSSPAPCPSRSAASGCRRSVPRLTHCARVAKN
jgi:DNA invertase Pin-like site-specific DNA recombinase